MLYWAVTCNTGWARHERKWCLEEQPEILVIYYVGMSAGQRLKDCVLLQWQNVDMEHQRIFVKQFKTGKEVPIPESKRSAPAKVLRIK